MRFTSRNDAVRHLEEKGWVQINERDLFHPEKYGERRSTVELRGGGWAIAEWSQRPFTRGNCTEHLELLDEIERRQAEALKHLANETQKAERDMRYRLVRSLDEHPGRCAAQAVADELAALIAFAAARDTKLVSKSNG